MTADTIPFEVRAARCCIDDKTGFLQILRGVAERYGTHIICFNADMLAGKRHAVSAMVHAIRSFENGRAISKTLEMEALLYAAGSRQCSIAASFGFHEGPNCLWVCCYPARDGVWAALMPIMDFQDGRHLDRIDMMKREQLLALFDITPQELESLDNPDRVVDLVLERVALLDVTR